MSRKYDLPAAVAGFLITAASVSYLPVADAPLIGIAGATSGVALIGLGLWGHSARRRN